MKRIAGDEQKQPKLYKLDENPTPLDDARVFRDHAIKAAESADERVKSADERLSVILKRLDRVRELLFAPDLASERKQELKEQEVKIERELAQAEAKLDQARNDLAQARNDLAQARNVLKEAEAKLEQSKTKLQDRLPEIRQILLRNLAELPTLEELKQVIKEDFPIKIPIAENVFTAICSKAGYPNTLTEFSYLRAATMESITSLEDPFRQIAYRLNISVFTSEDRLHSMFDDLIGKPFFDLLGYEFSRNQIDKAPTPLIQEGKRPYFLLSIKNILVVRGEEKSRLGSIDAAFKDLAVKCRKWNPAVLGRLPYVFGYAAAGYKIRIYAIYPRHDLTVCFQQIGRELNLEQVMDALELVKWIFNLARIIKRLVVEIPLSVPPLGQRWRRSSKQCSEVTIHDGYVEKLLRCDSGYDFKWKGGLEDLYALKIKNVIRLRAVDITSRFIKLELEPLAFREEPRNQKELHRCLEDVLTALKEMHENGWVHRDIKSGNVLHCLDDSWMVIDLEYAVKLDPVRKDAERPFFDISGYLMPDRASSEERWRPKHDVQQVGLMLENFTVLQTHPRAPELVAAIMNSESASEALQYIEGFFS